MYTKGEKIIPIYIEDEMKDSYISYAMSVIVGRALPNARDGLKPVHRRILYAMKELNLEHNKSYRKSARIVGDCLGKFHPHGDMAVYDALVRMVQDFSLRYPLIDGQGNFGCFTKETKVKLTDGRMLSFGELVEEERQGKKNYTYTYNTEKHQIEIAQIKSPRLTKRKAGLVGVKLDNGEKVKCTPNHLFMLRDGAYRQAQDLKSGDSLMPLYTRLSTLDDDPNITGYEMVYQPFANEWGYSHRLADEWNIQHGIYSRSVGRIRHHLDFNKSNNNPDNIRSEELKARWKNKEYAKYMAEIMRKRSYKMREDSTHREHINQLNRERWLDPEYRGLRITEPAKIAKTGLNHQVISVKRLRQKEDVYDLTVEDTHNFALAGGVFVHNSIDGDAPAAMRYTEARLSAITEWMLQDLEKDTVNFVPNFDESLTEPAILPAVLPNLLVNGSSGIAVGMATNIPPHNLSEIVEGVNLVIDHPDCEAKDLMRQVKGPDFPTGGFICGREGIKEAYLTGRGRLKVRAKANIEQSKSGKEAIVITEIPYQVNKTNILESIADLVQNRKVEGIADLRDESDKDGMRIVVDLRRGANAQVVLNQLFKHTQMEETFGVIMLALVDNQPRILNLKQLLQLYVEHRKDIIIRRTKFELARAEERAHILEGLKVALKYLDKVIKTIRQSKTPQLAKDALMKEFSLSEKQAQAILEMQLQRLTALERDKIDQEYLELIKKIEQYKAILASEKLVLGIVKDELEELKKKFGDERRTQIVAEAEDLEIEDLIAEEDVVLTISHTGYIKRLPVSAYRIQRRGGRGVTGMETKEEDFVEHLFLASTHEYILCFTNKGKVYWLKVHEIPQAGRLSKGKAIINLLQLESGEKVLAHVPVKEFDPKQFLVLTTRQGLIKKTRLDAFNNPRRAGIVAISIEKDDELIAASLTDGKQEILLASRQGKAVRFKESNVRDMGRAAKGVRAIRLAKKDEVVGMEIVRPEATLLTVTTGGFGKRTSFKEYRLQSRGGKGVINIKVTKKNGEVVGLKTVTDQDEVMIITQNGMVVRCPVKDIRAVGRNAQGVRIIRLDAKDQLSSLCPVVKKEEE